MGRPGSSPGDREPALGLHPTSKWSARTVLSWPGKDPLLPGRASSRQISSSRNSVQRLDRPAAGGLAGGDPLSRRDPCRTRSCSLGRSSRRSQRSRLDRHGLIGGRLDPKTAANLLWQTWHPKSWDLDFGPEAQNLAFTADGVADLWGEPYAPTVDDLRAAARAYLDRARSCGENRER
jgi:hypothetical protein